MKFKKMNDENGKIVELKNIIFYKSHIEEE